MIVDDVVEMFVEVEVLLKMIYIGGDEVFVGVWMDFFVCCELIVKDFFVKSFVDLLIYFIGCINKILME